MTQDWELAIRQRDRDGLERQLNAGADVNARDQHGQTGLMCAARDGWTVGVRLLIDHHAELDHTAKYHLSALMLAVLNGHAAIVRMLVAAGADQTIRGTGAPGFHGKTARDLAEQPDRPELLQALDG